MARQRRSRFEDRELPSPAQRARATFWRGALEQHGGHEVKHAGDGVMASFPSAVAVVTAGLAMQREFAGGEVQVRIGLNAAAPIAEDGGIGGAVPASSL